MKIDSPSVLRWYSATLGLAAGAVLYTYLGFGPVLPGALIFALVSYYSLEAVRKTDAEDNRYQKLSETIAVLGMVAFLPMIIAVDFLVALLLFLGFAQLALNFQTYDYRRFYVGIAVSFTCICVGATESKSGFYLVFFLAYTITAGITIGYAYMMQRRKIGIPQWDLPNRIRVCILLIGMATVIYLVLPRLPAGGLLAQPGSDHFYRDRQWEMEAKQHHMSDAGDRIDDALQDLRRKLNSAQNKEQGEQNDHGQVRTARPKQQGKFHYKGFQPEFDITNPDEKGDRFSNRIVARMRADQPQYLRARIFDLFDGLHWRASSDQTLKLSVGFNGVELVPSDQYTSSQLQSYEIFISIDLGDYIAAAAVPVKLQFPATAIAVDIFGQLRCPGALKAGTAYAVTSQYNLIRGRLFAELDHQPLPSYTQLPNPIDPRISDLAAAIVKDAPSQMDAAVALEQYLRTHYTYDLQSIFTSQNETPLSDFLFESKKGHCEYFASALAVMLRTQNIPSRLVTGFAATNHNPMTGYYDIYALDGHAWVEAFVDDQGWVILEPTAYYDGPLPKTQTLSAKQINEYVQRLVRLRKALGQGDLTLTGIINSIWQLFYVLFSAALGYVKLFMINLRYLILIVLSLGIVAWLCWHRYRDQWLAYRIMRRVDGYPAEKPAEAVTFYLSAIEELLELAGFNIPAGYTIERYLQRMRSIGCAHTDPILAAAFNRIYYNGEAGDQDVIRNYRQLFQSLYRTGLNRLQALARAEGSTG